MSDNCYINPAFFHPFGPYTEPTSPPRNTDSPVYQQQYLSPPVEYHYHYHYPPHPHFEYLADMPSAPKRVHWNDDELEARRTPSPAFSTGSTASSAGPITPDSWVQSLPQVYAHYPPHQYNAYPVAQDPYVKHRSHASPSSSPSGSQIHPLMSPAAHSHPSSQPFVWDVSLHPNQLRSHLSSGAPNAYPIPSATLSNPATTPPVASLTVRCTLLPWELRVHPTKTFGQPYVTVGDIFAEVYNMLRTQVSGTEFRTVCAKRPDVQQRIEQAFFTRCSMLDKRSDERGKGIRRVDLLMGSLMFAGLEVVKADNSLLLILRPMA